MTPQCAWPVIWRIVGFMGVGGARWPNSPFRQVLRIVAIEIAHEVVAFVAVGVIGFDIDEKQRPVRVDAKI